MLSNLAFKIYLRCYTTGVALNAAAQATWTAAAAGWGAVPAALLYAVVLSCITIAAASFGASYFEQGGAGTGGRGGAGGGGGGGGGGAGGAGAGGGGGGATGSDRAGGGDDDKEYDDDGGLLPVASAAPKAARISTRQLIAELCVSEEKAAAYTRPTSQLNLSRCFHYNHPNHPPTYA